MLLKIKNVCFLLHAPFPLYFLHDSYFPYSSSHYPPCFSSLTLTFNFSSFLASSLPPLPHLLLILLHLCLLLLLHLFFLFHLLHSFLCYPSRLLPSQIFPFLSCLPSIFSSTSSSSTSFLPVLIFSQANPVARSTWVRGEEGRYGGWSRVTENQGKKRGRESGLGREGREGRVGMWREY